MKNKMVKNVGVILGCSILAKILSYVWEAILAAYLGASDQADAFYMTTSIYGILYPVLDLGIWKVFLPIYKRKLAEGNDSLAERIANTTVTLFFTMSVALVLFFIVCANPLVSLIAPGYEGEKRSLTIEYLRISAPAYLLMACASVIGAMLQSREKFFGSQIRELGTHVSKILYVLVCFRFLGIYAAVTAIIVGSVFRLLVQLPFINWKWRFRPNFHFKDREIIPMLRGLPSVAITSAISHINGAVDKMIASNSESGSVSCLNYGHKLINVFSGMISTAISTAVYPTMIQNIAKNEIDKLKLLFTKVVNTLIFLIVPISCFCIFFSKELVTVAFQRGAFDSSATALTAEVFVGYSIGMLFFGISTIVSNVFYGFGDTKTSMFISILNIGLNIVLNLTFVNFWGVAGLAYATSVASVICLSIRFYLLKRFFKVDYRSLFSEFAKIILLALLSCGIPFIVFGLLFKVNLYLSLILSAVMCFLLYFLSAIILKIETLNFVRNLIKKKTKRKV